MNVVALLTGRGNNTLKNKNILPVNGIPLLSYPANAAKNSGRISHFYVSSDDNKILDIAANLGYKKIRRPDKFALPTSKHIDAIFHAVDYMKNEDSIVPDILVVLLANTVTVKSEWIQEGISIIEKDDSISSVVPVYQEQDHHPYRAKKLNQNGFLDTFFDFSDMEVSTNRQELEPVYFLSHNFWILNMNKSLYCTNGQKPWVFLGNQIKPILIDESFDVHTEEDIKRSERWIDKNLNVR